MSRWPKPLHLLPLLLMTALAFFLASPAAAQSKDKDEAPKEIRSERLAAVDRVIEDAVRAGQIPGAVVLVGHDGEVIHRRAFGRRGFGGNDPVMTLDTVFDMASLTKSMATAPSVMRLLEQGQIRLNDPISRYIPECAANGKEDITIRQLLTHYSGLAPDLDLRPQWSGYDTAIRLACAEPLREPPGTRFVYSDINFILLGEMVVRLAKMPLPLYADAHIFQPLGMKHTRFLPPAEWRAKIAPTEFDGVYLQGSVNDPTSRRMGGVAGHAGLFSTADDIARYAQALLDKKFLTPAIIEKMTTPQQPVNGTALRGLGWDIDSQWSTNRGELLPVGSFGHTGYAGTSLWIDPDSRTYVIVLTNRIDPKMGNHVPSLRTRVATVVAEALKLDATAEDRAHAAAITGYNETLAGARRLGDRNGQVKLGIDVLEQTGFSALHTDRKNAHGMNVAVFTNQTGLDSSGQRTVDVIAHAQGVKLAAIFSPEHGLFGNVDTEEVPDTTDAATGATVYSLYRKGRRGRVPAELLKGIDAIVFDIQDAGARYYSYEVTLGYVMETAAQAGVEVVVLDRPNPVTGSFVQGPMAQGGPQRLINYVDVPVRHGMTMGELAQMYNGERHVDGKMLGAKLTVVPMQGWQRGDWFDATGAAWVDPSPNLRSVNEATLYPGVALVEGTNVSVGRGTNTPFEVIGAPWIKGREFAAYMNARQIPGARFVTVDFTPSDAKYKGELCHGVNVIVTQRNVLDSPELGIELAVALRKLYPNDWKPEKMADILANQGVYDAVARGEDPQRIAEDWRDALEAFMKVRAKYLIYK